KLANLYYNFNDFENVKNLLIGINDTKAKVLLAKTYVRLKDYDNALTIFDQVGQAQDGEYLYFYASTLEEKNLYPKAVAIYKNIKGEYAAQAKERLAKIGLKVEEGMPENVKKLLKEQEKFLSGIEKEEAAILHVDEVNEIKADNSSVATAYMVEKILKEKGKDLAEVEIGYDSTYERVELEFARTITPEGKIVYAGAENIRDVSKYLNFPLYSNAKALIISMPSVDVGSIIEYKFKIYSSKLITGNRFSFIYRLREAYPIGQANFKLIVPKTDGVKTSFFNEEYAKSINFAPKVEEIKDTMVYNWQFKEIKPIIPEEPMPSISLINPAISVSNFSSWDEIYQWWEKLYKDKIELNKEVKEFVKNLTKDAKSDFEKAKKIYEFCAKNVRYVAVEYGESGYEPHYANDIFLNRYGDCKDKSILLVAMMREAGLRAYPVLIPTRGIYDMKKDFPSVVFDHAISAVVLGGKTIFMDATAQTVAFSDIPLGDQERNVLVFLDDKYEILTTPLLKDNAGIYETTLNIDANEDAIISRKVTTEGFFSSYQRYYFKYTHPDAIKADIQKKMVQISPFSKLINYKTENEDDFDKNPIMEYTFSAQKVLNPAGGLRIIPVLDDIDLHTTYAGREERSFPIEFAGVFKKISKIKVNLPDNLAMQFLPGNRELNTPWFTFKSTYAAGKGFVEINRQFDINKRFVQVDEYKEFKKNLEQVFYLLREEVILKKKQ
ncbi:MAG: DUF3857 and transglutaminase domain-containing protein, partial [Candidatus Omnitrophota bacterium]